MATDFQFRAGPHDEEELFVLNFTGTEGISQPFRFDIMVGAQDVVIDFEEMIGAEACFTFATPEGDRCVHGIVARWEEFGPGRHWVTYRATLVPPLWTLGLTRDSRIFQNQNTPDIVKAVLTDAGIPSDQFKFSLQESYPPRTYCVQYAESDLAFVTRLLEEEGMFYFFQQTEDGCTMVIADSNDACVALDGDDTFQFREGDTGALGDEQVLKLRYARSLRVGAVSLFEYDFKKPALKLEAEEKDSDASGEAKFAAEDYPGEYPDQGVGDRLAGIRLEEQRAERYLGLGESDCRRFTPGWRFTLEDHPNDALCQEYLLLQVRHRGTQPQAGHGGASADAGQPIYRNQFDCIPSSIVFRPLRATPRPHIDGLQTAEVVGPSGEEIHCDEYGRVKVRFPWDRSGVKDDKASCWIRVSQQWGGSGWGGMQIPRIGQEVVVEFLEGDPDRPLITGRVYNGGNPVPYELPHQKVMMTLQSSSSPGGASANEVRFNDTGSGEEMFTHASKDMNHVIENDRNMKVHATETVAVDGAVLRSVDGAEDVSIVLDRSETVGGGQTTLVTKDVASAIEGSLSRAIGGLRLRGIGGDFTLDVTGENGRTVGPVLVDLVKGEMKREADGDATITAGALAIELVKGDHSEESDADYNGLVGALVLKKTQGDYERNSDGGVVFASATVKIDGENVEIEGKGQLALVVGGSSIVVAPGSITITSDKITVEASSDWKGSGTPSPWN